MVRFIKSGYGYVAVRSGEYWETSATQSVGFIDEVMRWNEIWFNGTYFELAEAFDPVRQPAERDRRLSQESVVCFSLADEHCAAIGYQGTHTGFKQRLWFTTLSPAARKCGKLRSSYGQWAEIMHNAQEIHVVTSWRPLIPDGAKTSGRGWRTR